MSKFGGKMSLCNRSKKSIWLVEASILILSASASISEAMLPRIDEKGCEKIEKMISSKNTNKIQSCIDEINYSAKGLREVAEQLKELNVDFSMRSPVMNFIWSSNPQSKWEKSCQAMNELVLATFVQDCKISADKRETFDLMVNSVHGFSKAFPRAPIPPGARMILPK